MIIQILNDDEDENYIQIDRYKIKQRVGIMQKIEIFFLKFFIEIQPILEKIRKERSGENLVFKKFSFLNYQFILFSVADFMYIRDNYLCSAFDQYPVEILENIDSKMFRLY